jgi:NAD(P)-dependent dehydrogenase (short-subunit alcohol dehydrogenase family)
MKTAIVTGASGNMGQAVIKKFIDEGYKVIGTIIP